MSVSQRNDLKNCFLNYNCLLQAEYRNGIHLECSPKCSHVSTMIAQSNSQHTREAGRLSELFYGFHGYQQPFSLFDG